MEVVYLDDKTTELKAVDQGLAPSQREGGSWSERVREAMVAAATSPKVPVRTVVPRAGVTNLGTSQVFCLLLFRPCECVKTGERERASERETEGGGGEREREEGRGRERQREGARGWSLIDHGWRATTRCVAGTDATTSQATVRRCLVAQLMRLSSFGVAVWAL